MAFVNYLTTTAEVWLYDETRSEGGGMNVEPYAPAGIDSFACSQPVPTDPSRGETLGRDGVVLTHKVYFEGPRKGLRPGHQLRIDGRRFEVDCELDSVGFGRIVKALVREAVA